MKHYTLSIETNDHSISINSFSNKKDAIREAAYYRTGGATWNKQLMAYENPQVHVYDTVKEESVYTKPLFKNALKQ